MKKIIIRTPNFIGDTINTTPCLELIKQEYPEAEFTIVGPDFVRELFKYDPRITHYITFPLKRKKKLSTYWKIVRELRKEICQVPHNACKYIYRAIQGFPKGVSCQ